MAIDRRLEMLRQRHQDLDFRLKDEMARPMPDTSVVNAIRSKKLKMKDEMTRIEHAVQEHVA